MSKILKNINQIKQQHINVDSVRDYCEFSGAYAGWKDQNFIYQDVTENTPQLFNACRASDLIGRSEHDLSQKFYADIYVRNDQKVLQSEKSWCGIEVADWHGFGEIMVFSNKAPLFDRDFAKVIGVIFLCYPVEFTDFSPNELNFIDQLIENNKPKNPFKLTPREQQCLELIVSGLSAKEIARVMNISYRTVEFHVANMKEKMGCKNKAEMIVLALNGNKL